jgi:group I intron endonuclease
MRKAFIYKVTHIDSGRVYIGQTRDKKGINNRWSVHTSCARRNVYDTYFHNAIRKYGESAFAVELLDECTVDTVNTLEKKYIAEYQSNDKQHGFNMSEGGDGGQNTLSPEVRKKISDAKKGKPTGVVYTPEVREKIAASKRGKPRSEETIKKMKENRKVAALSDSWKTSISVGLKMSTKFSLSKQQANEIVAKLPSHSDSSLSVEYKVSRATIWKIRKGLFPLAANYTGNDAHLYQFK